MIPLLQSTAQSIDDEELRQSVKQLRIRLGYWDLPEREFKLPPWLKRWLEKLEEIEPVEREIPGWERFGEWLFQESGWIILTVIIVLILLLLVYLSLRSIRRKRKMPALHENTGMKTASARIQDRNTKQWTEIMETSRKEGDYSRALVALYRSVLTGLMDRLGLLDPLSNREISQRMEGEERAYFQRLYRRSDAFVFGEHPIEEDTFLRLHQEYEELFHG